MNTPEQHINPSSNLQAGDVGAPGIWQVRDFMEEEAPEPGNPVKALMRIFRGQWLLGLGLGLLFGCGFAFLAFQFVKPGYESEGLVRLVAREQKILYADKDDTRLRLYDAFVSSETTYLQSRPVLERAFEIIVSKQRDNTTNDTDNQDKLKFKDFAQSIVVKKLKGLISVMATSSNAAKAKGAVNAVLKSYVELHTEQSGSRKTMRARELDVRVQELAAKQYELSRQLLEIGEEYDQYSLAKAHLTKVTQLEELNLRIEELANTLIEMETSDGALDADTGDMEIKRATLLDRAMADMVFERAKRAADLEKLLLRYQRTHPKVSSLSTSLKVIDDAIESRRRLIATLGKTGAITGGDGAAKEQSMGELRALHKKLSARKAELSADAKNLNSKLISLKRINEEKSQVTGMLEETRRILDQVRLESRNSLPGTIEILSYGSLPELPAKDKRLQFAILAFMMGGFLPLVALFARRQFSGTIMYSDDYAATISSVVTMTVMDEQPDPADISAFLSDLQVHDSWQTQGTTLISFTRFEAASIPLEAIAETASAQGFKTLLVCASEEGQTSEVGFTESISGKQKVAPCVASGFDYMPFGRCNMVGGFSVETARSFVANFTEDYNLILFYTGVSGKHFASRILPRLSHITVACACPGDQARSIRRLYATSNQQPIALFTGAHPNDPGLTPIERKQKGHKND